MTTQPHILRAHSTQVQQSKQLQDTIPFFSVIICTYNRRTMLLATLASLRKQTLPYTQFEVIVVDNGSTDGTFKAAQIYARTDTLPLQKHGMGAVWQVRCLQEIQNGLAHARNTGLQAARGAIAVFIDDDTLVDPHFLANLATTYRDTGADAVGGCVELRWEAPRPHWLRNDMLTLLGYFVPYRTRMPLPENLGFSNSCFSAKIIALQEVGGFLPFLSKRLNSPMSLETEDLCRRLRKAGYTLWYEPSAIVLHRISSARLHRAFLIGRAYWIGRSEVLNQYKDIEQYRSIAQRTFMQTLQAAFPELLEVIQLACIDKPLSVLAHKSTRERLMTDIARAYHWGRIMQQFLLINHIPALLGTLAVLLVRPTEQDTSLLVNALLAEEVHCTTCHAYLPLFWLWRHRADMGQVIGIVHIYRAGAFDLNYWQRQLLLLQLWLAHRLGLRIVVTDTGGWWQNVRTLRFSPRRSLEKRLLAASDIVLSYTHHLEQLYPNKKLRARTRYLSHPGLYGTIVQVERKIALQQLGLPASAGFVYICLAYLHTEREVIQLIEAFSAMKSHLLHKYVCSSVDSQLVLVGLPKDKKQTFKVLKRAALNPSIHLCMVHTEAAIPLYIGAANALVMPHFAVRSAGILDIAMLFYAYERVIIVPDLPRLRGMFPPYASVLYGPGSAAELGEALLIAQTREYRHDKKETLEARASWHRYTQRLLEIYKPLLNRNTVLKLFTPD